MNLPDFLTLKMSPSDISAVGFCFKIPPIDTIPNEISSKALLLETEQTAETTQSSLNDATVIVFFFILQKKLSSVISVDFNIFVC